jgi:hypothetical protein
VRPPRSWASRNENLSRTPSARFETDSRPPGDREWAPRAETPPNERSRSRRRRDPADERSRFEEPGGDPADEDRRRSVMSRRARAENRRRNGPDLVRTPAETTQLFSVVNEEPGAAERRRPRPRPRPEPVADRSTTVYVSRHAADPPHPPR